MDNKTIAIRKQICYMVWFFMVSLAISGLTAIPAKAGIGFLLDVVPVYGPPLPVIVYVHGPAAVNANCTVADPPRQTLPNPTVLIAAVGDAVMLTVWLVFAIHPCASVI